MYCNITTYWYIVTALILNSPNICTSSYMYWASQSEPNTSGFNVEFCLYGMNMYVSPYIVAGAAGSDGHSYRVPVLPPHVHVHVLSCPIPSPSSRKYVQQWDHAWATPTGKGGENTAAETLDERTAALQRLRTATSLTPAPQSSTSTYSNFVLSGVHELRTAAKSIKLITYMHAEHDSSVLPYLVLQVLSCLHWQSCMATITCHYGACDTCTRKWGCTPKQMQKTSILGAAGHALCVWLAGKTLTPRWATTSGSVHFPRSAPTVDYCWTI